jgi:hypothetical protein
MIWQNASIFIVSLFCKKWLLNIWKELVVLYLLKLNESTLRFQFNAGFPLLTSNTQSAMTLEHTSASKAVLNPMSEALGIWLN